MALNFTKTAGAKKHPPMDTGAYPARIAQIVDLGIQENEWQGEVKDVHRVYFTFEFPTETISIDGVDKPRWLSKEYTVSMADKSGLSKLVNSADPDGKLTKNGINVKALLGQPLIITVGRTSAGNAKVSDVGPIMKGMTVPELVNSPVFFELDGDDVYTFDKLPQWLRDKVTSSKSFESSPFCKAYRKSSNETHFIDEDIPY